MEIEQIISWFITIISLLAAIFAWSAKLFWSKEFISAKNESIKALEAQLQMKDESIRVLDARLVTKDNQIEELRHMNPVIIKEYFKASMDSLGEIIAKQDSELELSKKELIEKEEQISLLLPEQQADKEKIVELKNTRSILQKRIAKIEANIMTDRDVVSNFESLLKDKNISDSFDRISSYMPERIRGWRRNDHGKTVYMLDPID